MPYLPLEYDERTSDGLVDSGAFINAMSWSDNTMIKFNSDINHQAVIDTINGTSDFPHVEMMIAMTDEMKNCNPKPLQIRAEGNKFYPRNKQLQCRQKKITTSTNDARVAVQPLPQFEETAKIFVTPELATAQ